MSVTSTMWNLPGWKRRWFLIHEQEWRTSTAEQRSQLLICKLHWASTANQEADRRTRPRGWGFLGCYNADSELQKRLANRMIVWKNPACRLCVNLSRKQIHTCEVPPARVTTGQLAHPSAKYKPEEQPAGQPECHAVMWSRRASQ